MSKIRNMGITDKCHGAFGTLATLPQQPKILKTPVILVYRHILWHPKRSRNKNTDLFLI